MFCFSEINLRKNHSLDKNLFEMKLNCVIYITFIMKHLYHEYIYIMKANEYQKVFSGVVTFFILFEAEKKSRLVKVIQNRN